MQLVLHRKVHSDVDAIMEYYERVASRELADDFYAELRRFLFRIVGDSVRILVVRHHRRHPALGIHRR